MLDEDWHIVQSAARGVTRATKAGDPNGRAARFADFQAVLAKVRQRHGSHPVLWELEADFAADTRAAADLYMKAEGAALDAGLPTLSIRLSLARLFVEELARPDAAQATLLACAEELPSASEKQCATWAELLAECERSIAEALSGGQGRLP